MANGNLRFGIKISADGSQATGEVRSLARAVTDAGDAANASARQIDGLSASVSRYITAAAGVFSAGKLIAAADEWGQLASRINIAAGSADAAAEATSRLMEVSNRSYKSFGNSAELYVRTAKALDELGYSSDQALGMVEALQYGLTVSAAGQEQSANVINAWSKAINQGKMHMLEFQSVLNGAPRLVQALAESLGVTTVELQGMVRDGKITSDMLIGVSSQVKKLGEEADRMPVTLKDSFVRAQNNLMKFAGSAEQNTGVIKALTTTITKLGDNIDLVAAAAGTVAVAAFGRYVAAMQGKIVANVRAAQTSHQAAIAEAELQLAQARSSVVAAAAASNITALTAARVRETAATAALAAAQRGASVASGLAGSAMAALGGPIGLVITALGAAAIAWSTYSARAKAAAESANSAAADLTRQRRLLAGETAEQIRQNDYLAYKLKQVEEAEASLAKTEAGIAKRRAEGRTSKTDEEYYSRALEKKKKELEDAREAYKVPKELMDNGGTSAELAANARYSVYISERRSLTEQLKSDLQTEADAFAGATRTLQKDSTEYATALEAYNRKVKEINDKYAKKERTATPRTPRDKEESLHAMSTRVSAGADTAMGEAYDKVMKELIADQNKAAVEGRNLTEAQKALQTVMLNPAWNRMPEPWKEVIRAQAEAADRASATAAYNTAMQQMDAAIASAAKSTLDLNAAQSTLYDLMLSPAWANMSETERLAAVARAESATATLKELELEKALQDAKAKTAAASKERMDAQLGYVDKEVESGRLDKKTGEEIKTIMQQQAGSLEKSIFGAVARGLMSGFQSGGDLIQSLGSSLQSVLMQYSQEGLQKGFESVFKEISAALQKLFSDAGGSAAAGSSSGSGWGAIISAVASLFASANGNAFAASGPMAFASGGAFGAGEILRRPTYFRFASGGAFRAGVAGEAGPEGALPLKRMSNGKLGVYAEGGNSAGVNVGITINVVNNSSEDRNEERSGDDNADYVALAHKLEGVSRGVIVTELRPGGLLAGR